MKILNQQRLGRSHRHLQCVDNSSLIAMSNIQTFNDFSYANSKENGSLLHPKINVSTLTVSATQQSCFAVWNDLRSTLVNALNALNA
jgi:hypothetical protein